MTPIPQADVRSGQDVPTVTPGEAATEPALLTDAVEKVWPRAWTSYGLSLASLMEPTCCGLMRTGRLEAEFFNSIDPKRKLELECFWVLIT
jgi:hypothetical protein